MKLIRINEENPAAITATVDIGGQVRELPATVGGDGNYRHYTIYGLAVRYQTGTKVWPGSIVYWPANGHFNGLTSTQDHRGRKPSLSIVGYWADAKDAYRSAHNSVA